jgi:hypothetical protein
MNWKIKWFALGLILVFMSAYVLADFAQTAVYFTVPVALSFTVTLPGAAAEASSSSLYGSGYSADVIFNSSVADNATVIPCVSPGTSCQNESSAIFIYDNTGTQNISIYMKFNATLPTGVTVLMNSSVTTAGLGFPHTLQIPVNSTQWAQVVASLPYTGTNTSSVWMYAAFDSYSGSNVVYLTHNSTT